MCRLVLYPLGGCVSRVGMTGCVVLSLVIYLDSRLCVVSNAAKFKNGLDSSPKPNLTIRFYEGNL